MFPRLGAWRGRVVWVLAVFSEAWQSLMSGACRLMGDDIGYESVKPTLTTLRETWGGSWGRQLQDRRRDREAMSPMV